MECGIKKEEKREMGKDNEETGNCMANIKKKYIKNRGGITYCLSKLVQTRRVEVRLICSLIGIAK